MVEVSSGCSKVIIPTRHHRSGVNDGGVKKTSGENSSAIQALLGGFQRFWCGDYSRLILVLCKVDSRLYLRTHASGWEVALHKPTCASLTVISDSSLWLGVPYPKGYAANVCKYYQQICL